LARGGVFLRRQPKWGKCISSPGYLTEEEKGVKKEGKKSRPLILAQDREKKHIRRRKTHWK